MSTPVAPIPTTTETPKMTAIRVPLAPSSPSSTGRTLLVGVEVATIVGVAVLVGTGVASSTIASSGVCVGRIALAVAVGSGVTVAVAVGASAEGVAVAIATRMGGVAVGSSCGLIEN